MNSNTKLNPYTSLRPIQINELIYALYTNNGPTNQVQKYHFQCVYMAITFRGNTKRSKIAAHSYN